MPRFLAIFLLVCLGAHVRAQDGIFADFQTSLGNFTCELDYVRVPRTVANFIGLATGARAWVDFTNGEASHRPFYNGLKFHRVVKDFVIQGGSPKGDGTDGPGYTFRDEFHPDLRHTSAGVLSMANSGLNSNGSQFFITLVPTQFLDDVHTIFGKVAAGPFGGQDAGLTVVQKIGVTPVVDSGGQPVTPVIMNSVAIRRVGVAAQAFDINAQGLPTVGGNAVRVVHPTATTYAVQIPRTLYSQYWFYQSPNLTVWNGQQLAIDVTPPPVPYSADLTSLVAGGTPRYFFRVPEVAYPGPIYTPISVSDKTFSFTTTSVPTTPPSTPIQAVISLVTAPSANGLVAQYKKDGGTASTAYYQWTQEAYRGRIAGQSTTVLLFNFQLVYTSATGGTLKGTIYGTPGYECTGTFTVTP